MTRKLTFLILALFALISGPGWGQQSTYTKVTSTNDLTSGDTYLIVYEAISTEGRIFNGLDAANDYVTASISNSNIANVPEGSCPVIISSMTGGYSIYLTSGDKEGNYIYGKSGSNSIQYGANAVANSITITDGAATIESYSTSLRYNSASGNDRFRYYKTTTTGATYIYPALYKLQAPSTDPVINAEDVELAYDATSGEISYSITNPISSTTLSAETNDTWISGITVNASNVTFTTTENETSSQRVGTITLSYTGATSKDVTVTQAAAPQEGVLFYESFDTNNGTGGNDGQWSGSIASNDLESDNENWTFVKGSGAKQCAKFGTGSAKGSATTPSISYNGDATLTFKAAAWDGNSEGTTLNISATSGTLSQASVTLVKGAWTEYSINITNVTNSTQITFEANNASNNRFFLDEVKVLEAEAPSVATPTFTPAAGTYDEPQNVTIECETEGAAIYYTTDGTNPTEDSYLYISAIEIDETTTIKAIAYLNGEASDIATAEYEIVELYTITVDPSVFGEVTTYPADRAAAGTEVTIIISSIEEHYHVKEIHVYDGYAQEINVDDNGKFIMPESLVGVSVIFEEDQQCNISYYCNGSFDDSGIVYAGPIGELREPSGSIPEGFTFAGWSTSMASITAITKTYNVSEDTDLFAIFAKVEGGSGEATATLTNSDITGSSLTNTYGDFSITNTYGTWSGNGCKQGNFSGDGMHFLQLRNNSTVSYLKLPVFPGNITSIVCEQVCNTSKEQYTGNIYFRTEADNNADAIVAATSNDALDNVTLNIPSGYNTGYIMVSAACRIYSFTVTYQSGVTKYYTRVFQDEYVMDDINIEGPSIIPAGSTLNMGAYTLANATAANLIIEDGAQLIQNSSNVKATVLKNITGYSDAASRDGYYLVANPTATVANDEYDALDGCTAAFDLYTFNPAAAFEWVNIGSTTQKVTFDRNVGYLYANAQDMALHFRGYLLPTNVTTDIDLVYYEGEEGDGREFPGFNLIGNPYTCDAYISGGYFHFYKMVEGELQLAATSVAIAPCEGFFVEATGTDLSISINTVAPEPASTLNLTVSQNRGNVIDRAIVNFNGRNDLHKFMMNPAHTNLSIAKGGETFAAISTEAEGELPVNFKAEKNGSYTITVNTENVEANYLHLIDNLTGMDTDLLSTPSYTFDAKTSDYASRFKLVFGMKDDTSAGSVSESFAYVSNGEIVISNEGRATLQVIDVLGRVISSETINGECRISTNGMTAGLYILSLNGMTQKIVVD